MVLNIIDFLKDIKKKILDEIGLYAYYIEDEEPKKILCLLKTLV